MPSLNALSPAFYLPTNPSDGRSRQNGPTSTGSGQAQALSHAVPAVTPEVEQANRQVRDSRARARFETRVIHTRPSVSALATGLDRWVNTGGIDPAEGAQRQQAKARIVEAYRQGARELCLDNLSLTSLPREIGYLSTLETLDLKLNQLTQLPAEIGQLIRLTRLDLNGNQLMSLPPQIGRLQALSDLDLEWNQLETLPAEIGQLGALQTLDLSINPLTHLPPAIAQLGALRQLHLSGNQLTELPPEIGQLRALERLSLSGNQLSHLPAAITGLGALNVLHLQGNQFQELGPEITQLSSLVELELEYNSLTQLPTNIAQLRGLTRLGLAQNQIASLPPELAQLTRLEQLDLSGNRLSHIELATLPGNPQLAVNVEDNIFSSSVVQAITQRQNQEAYSGPQVHLSEISTQPTDDLSAANIKEVLTRLGHSTVHPLWSALEQRSEMGNVANDFTLLLAKLYNQAPRENDQLTGRISQHIEKVLSTLEQLQDQSQAPAIEDMLNHAHDAVASCVDRAAIHLLLMSAKGQFHLSGDRQAMGDVHTIDATIRFVARLYKNDEHKLVFDKHSQTFQHFFALNHDNYTDFSLIRHHDEVEDVLKLLNSGLLQQIDGCDMRFENCVNLVESQHLSAARHYILASLSE